MHLFVCLQINETEARLRDEEELPGHILSGLVRSRDTKKTVLLMDAESSPRGCLSLCPSLSPKNGGRMKEEWMRKRRVGEKKVRSKSGALRDEGVKGKTDTQGRYVAGDQATETRPNPI